MDLVSTVRKEGSRGGRGDFKWSDVQNSSHRENYLGHSLMAPVGRWQQGRDLGWYAKADEGTNEGEDPTQKAARERKEEIRKIKDAEQDALARALGFEVAPRNPNLETLGDKEVDRVLKEAAEDGDGEADGGKGIGFGAFRGTGSGQGDIEERMEGNAEKQDAELSYALKEYRRRHGDARHGDDDKRRRSRSRSTGRDRHREGRRHKYHSREETYHRRRSRSVERPRRRSRSRSRSREQRQRDDARARRRDDDRAYRRDRSRSPRRRDHRDDNTKGRDRPREGERDHYRDYDRRR